jgi:hypothetical protein
MNANPLSGQRLEKQDGRRRRSLWKGPALLTTVVLVLTLLGNHYVDGWNWPPGAFVVVGALIFGIGFTYALITRNEGTAYRAGVGIAFTAGFVLVWANLVQFADVNRAAAMYFGVPIVGISGAVVAGLQPDRLARALFATAIAQALVLSIMLMMRMHQDLEWVPAELRGFCGNAVLVLLFTGSALLFRKAARGASEPRGV